MKPMTKLERAHYNFGVAVVGGNKGEIKAAKQGILDAYKAAEGAIQPRTERLTPSATIDSQFDQMIADEIEDEQLRRSGGTDE